MVPNTHPAHAANHRRRVYLLGIYQGHRPLGHVLSRDRLSGRHGTDRVDRHGAVHRRGAGRPRDRAGRCHRRRSLSPQRALAGTGAHAGDDATDAMAGHQQCGADFLH